MGPIKLATCCVNQMATSRLYVWLGAESEQMNPAKYISLSRNNFIIFLFSITITIIIKPSIIIMVLTLILVHYIRWLSYSTVPTMATFALALIFYRLLKVITSLHWFKDQQKKFTNISGGDFTMFTNI